MKKIKKIYVEQYSILGKAINLIGLSVLGFVIYSAWSSEFLKDVSTHEVNSIKNWSVTKMSRNPVAYIEAQIRNIDKSSSDLQQSKIELEAILITSTSEIEVFNNSISIIKSENEELKSLYLNEQDPSAQDSIRNLIEDNLLILDMHQNTIKDNEALVSNINNDLDEIEDSLYKLKQLSAEYMVALKNAVSRDAIKKVKLPNPQDLAKMERSVETLTMSFKKDSIASAASQKLRIQERDLKFKKFMQDTKKGSFHDNSGKDLVTNNSAPNN